jgi:hypothetical protein
MKAISHGPGRPRKYGRPSRAVTMTLPEDVLTRLGALDADLGRAIVTLVERKGASRLAAVEPAEIAHYGSRAVIVVTPVRALKRIAGIQLVPTGNGRALIALDHPHSIAQLELGVRDALERGDLNELERQTLDGLADILRHTRSSRAISLQERTIIVIESKRQRRRLTRGHE